MIFPYRFLWISTCFFFPYQYVVDVCGIHPLTINESLTKHVRYSMDFSVIFNDVPWIFPWMFPWLSAISHRCSLVFFHGSSVISHHFPIFSHWNPWFQRGNPPVPPFRAWSPPRPRSPSPPAAVPSPRAAARCRPWGPRPGHGPWPS